MGCCAEYNCNLVVLDPDDQPVTLDSLSPTGWYILFRPETSAAAFGATPLPVYHKQGDTRFTGWTTTAPVDCRGQSNYPVGLCQLWIQRVEEGVTSIQGIQPDLAPSDKDSFDVTGRFVYPKINSLRHAETYCFFHTGEISIRSSQAKPFSSTLDQAYISDNGWILGFISYRQVPGQSLVSSKTFGSPITARIRSIGDYLDTLATLDSFKLSDNQQLTLPTVETILDTPASIIYNAGSQSIQVNNAPSGKMVIRFSQLPSGSVTSPQAVTQQIDGNDLIVRLDSTSQANLSIIGLTFPSYPVSAVAQIGNVTASFTI